MMLAPCTPRRIRSRPRVPPLPMAGSDAPGVLSRPGAVAYTRAAARRGPLTLLYARRAARRNGRDRDIPGTPWRGGASAARGTRGARPDGREHARAGDGVARPPPRPARRRRDDADAPPRAGGRQVRRGRRPDVLHPGRSGAGDERTGRRTPRNALRWGDADRGPLLRHRRRPAGARSRP